jgi:hypothetical protein
MHADKRLSSRARIGNRSDRAADAQQPCCLRLVVGHALG